MKRRQKVKKINKENAKKANKNRALKTKTIKARINTKNNEPTYKPSSVLRDYLSTSAVTDGLKRRFAAIPRRATAFDIALSCFGWGLHMREKLPSPRWAFTSPFHPYLFQGGFFLLHFPGSHLRRTLSVTPLYEARTFLVRFLFRSRAVDSLFCYCIITLKICKPFLIS